MGAVTAHRARGFTMLETVVVLVVVFILTFVALPSFAGVVDGTHDTMATTTLNDSMRLAQGIAALRDDGVFRDEDFITTTSGAVTYATASPEWTFTSADSGAYGQVSFEVSPNGQMAGVAMRSSSGRCGQGILVYGETPPPAQLVAAEHTCSGRTAGESLGDWAPYDGPHGAMPTTTADTSVAGTFTANRAGLFLLAGDDGIYADMVVLAAGALQVTSNGDGATVVLTPDASFTGTYHFTIRLTDTASNHSAVTAVTGEVTAVEDVPPDPDPNDCATTPRPLSYAHACSPLGSAAIIAGTLTVAQHTTVYGNIRTTGRTTISNFTRLDATEGTLGHGHLIGGPVTITNGSNAVIAGNVTISGDFTNHSPSTEVGGNLTTSNGSVVATRTLSVGGVVMVSAPHTISGPVVSGAGNVVVVGSVPGPAPAHVPSLDTSAVTFDATFSTWAKASAWFVANASSLGHSGAATVSITDTGAGVLDLADTHVNGDLLIVATGPLTMQSFPTTSLSSTLTIAVTDTNAGTLTVAANSPSTADTVLYAAGEVRFTQVNTLRGQVIGTTVTINQRTNIVGRPATPWSALILRHP